MAIRIISVGRKHEKWIEAGIERFQTRLKKPFDVSWHLIAHSAQQGDQAREEESAKIIKALKEREFVLLLDERGKNFTSPQLSQLLQSSFDSGLSVTVIIGGAYGVTEQLRQQAHQVWSLSNLVFPHQLVRLMLAEQIYRAQEISAGRSYHHV